MWKPVWGREGQYEISSCGQIKRCSGKVVGQWKSDQGYMLARLSNPRKTVRVHRLVAESFLDNPKGYPFVNHKDCNRANNEVSNLEWCTQWQNLNHSSLLGRMNRDFWKGKRSPSAKLSEDQAQSIRDIYSKGGVSWDSLARIFGTNKRTIGRIVRGESYVRVDGH